MERSFRVSVIIGTFGAESWQDLAKARALPSVEAQTVRPEEVLLVHGATLAQARNTGAANATGDWLCFLDADDELDPRYLEAMEAATGTLRAPAVQYVTDDVAAEPFLLADRDIRLLNPCVIGTLVPRTLFHQVGGFREEPVFEDWSLWLRCWNTGADIVHVSEAIYRAHVSPESRNNQGGPLVRRTYNDIRRRFGKRRK